MASILQAVFIALNKLDPETSKATVDNRALNKTV